VPDSRAKLREEFERAAPTFGERTRGRFDTLNAVEFARVEEGERVLEVGAGTGNFLQLFRDAAGDLIALDLTPGMLRQARSDHPEMHLVVGDGALLPFPSHSIDLVTSAQTLHHIAEPLPVLSEMRRVASSRVLVVDQVATDRYEEAVMLNKLEILRDPSHAASRPRSIFRVLMMRAGLEVVDERVVEFEQRLSYWMWPGEFPEERIEKVRNFIDRHGSETGLHFERDGDDYVFVRQRIMLLASSAYE
jgi:ubiquinone/menaquinone biosynthesis C-methylase UbiE